MPFTHPRMKRERRTIEAMSEIYCHAQHGTRGAELCADCRELRDYAVQRLDRCPFQETKSTCANCAVHCYKPDMRERVRAMMRFAGPRMLLYHPILAIWHLWVDGHRKAPQPIRRRASENT